MEIRSLSKRLKSPFALFVYRKFAFLFIAIFVAMSFVFVFSHLLPSSPVDIMIARIATGGGTTPIGTSTPGSEGGSRLEVMRRIYEVKFGINEPIIVQYVIFWRRFFAMDFGLSYWRYPLPVSDLIIHALPWTLVLALPVVPIGFFVGNWIGSRAAYYGGKLDNIVYIISNYVYRAPYYWFALILMLIFGVELKWFPLYGAYSPRWLYPVLRLDWILDAAWHFCLPFLSLVGLGIGGWAVGMRAMVLYEVESDYIDYSEQLGFRKTKLRKYAERNAILPNFTWLPMVVSGLISETLLVEVVFGYPGLGTLAYNAIFAMDYPLIEATFVISVLIVLIGNFICDILYGTLDPRIGSGYVSAE